MIYPNGFITIRKLEEMIDDPKNWIVIAKNKITNETITLSDRDDLREYLFYADYSIAYDFVGNWDEYNKPKEGILFDWKKNDLEIKVIKKDNKISAEILKWENNTIDSEDLPTCFVLAYWDKDDDLHFVGDRFFAYVPKDNLDEIYSEMKKVQDLLYLKEEED